MYKKFPTKAVFYSTIKISKLRQSPSSVFIVKYGWQDLVSSTRAFSVEFKCFYLSCLLNQNIHSPETTTGGVP